MLAAGEIPAAEAFAWLASKRGTPHAITLSSDAQASLPHFDAAGRLPSLEAAPIGSLPSAVVAAVQCHGLKLADALPAVTLNLAEVWGLVNKGSIAAGVDADLVLLEPDSLLPVGVIASGRLHLTRNGHGLTGQNDAIEWPVSCP